MKQATTDSATVAASAAKITADLATQTATKAAELATIAASTATSLAAKTAETTTRIETNMGWMMKSLTNIEQTLGEMQKSFITNEQHKEVTDELADHENRLRNNERNLQIYAGAITIIAFIIPILLKVFIKGW